MSAFLRALFPDSDPKWQWRRRMAFTGCAVFLSGILKVIWWPSGNDAIDSMILTTCTTGFGATLATYAGLATWDDRNKRNSEAQS